VAAQISDSYHRILPRPRRPAEWRQQQEQEVQGEEDCKQRFQQTRAAIRKMVLMMVYAIDKPSNHPFGAPAAPYQLCMVAQVLKPNTVQNAP